MLCCSLLPAECWGEQANEHEAMAGGGGGRAAVVAMLQAHCAAAMLNIEEVDRTAHCREGRGPKAAHQLQRA